MGVIGSGRMVPKSSGGGSGTGLQTGTGAPNGVVTPTQAGSGYSDQSTGVIWVALTASNTSWVVSGTTLASPAFTGTPSAPTAAPLTNSTQLATTAYADAAVAAATNPALYLAATYR